MSKKPNKCNLIVALPDCQMKSNYHSLKYDRNQSRADKSSAGSNHTSHKKHHYSCHLNPSISKRRYATKMKKEGRGVVNSVSQKNSNLKSKHPLTTKYIFPEPTVQVPKHKVSPTLPVQKAYSTQVKKKQLHDILDDIPEAKTVLAWKQACMNLKGKGNCGCT